MRLNLDKFFEEEPFEDKPTVTQKKISGQEEEDSTMVQE